jgi:bifunctional non-homologous end joining protein LigD
MLATSAAPFNDPACLFDLKWDGVRALVAVERDTVRCWGRHGVSYDGRYPELDPLRRRLPAGTMFDGELVVIREGGADFHALMARHRRRPGRRPFRAEPIRYVAFDLLYLGGRPLTHLSLSKRREMLDEILPDDPTLLRCQGVVGDGRRAFADAAAAGHEGVVAKRLTSRYEPNRRSGAWRKVKRRDELPCVVIGYRQGRTGLCLLMATLQEGRLAYVGAVDLGVTGGEELLLRLESLHRRTPAVSCSAPATWIEPKLLGVVRFAGWRPNGAWRDAAFAGWAEELV